MIAFIIAGFVVGVAMLIFAAVMSRPAKRPTPNQAIYALFRDAHMAMARASGASGWREW